MKASKILSTPASKIERAPITEEKIFVTVRVRPLSKKELALKDQEAWEVDGNKILFKVSKHRANFPASFIFDKVFGPTCLTERVYEEGAKDVALSSLTGINATIFLYGQTSSGKTYTMRGITENTVNDIYKHIDSPQNPEREYIIKISAMEIYNEVVRDLLKPNSGPLRLLNDPEKGTIVEKLEEESAKDSQHLRHLIGICEEQRQVGETSLNDTSSRSHQIIRLTIESNLRENSGSLKSFIASLNFVDLAGSERAALTHAIGARLKEGSHINRSLLTLTTVIRKLSQGKKSGHIPYRDSKLTRILQPSLGGNARTAIICTISPALTHVEQSRNTLFFANCAKEVTNSAKVNVVVSDKQLVEHLGREVARLEAELHTPESTADSHALLKEIKQMEMEMENLKKERDIAQLQLKELQKKADDESGKNLFEPPSNRVAKCLTFTDHSPLISEKWHIKAEQSRNQQIQSSVVPSMLMYEIRKLEQLRNEANQALEVLQKEFTCHTLGNRDAAETITKLQAEIREMHAFRTEEVDNGESANSFYAATSLKEEITRLHSQGSNLANLEEQLENVQKLIDKLMMSLSLNGQTNPSAPRSSEPQSKKNKLLPLNVSSNVNRPSIISTPFSHLSSSRYVMESEVENKVPDNDTVPQETVSCCKKATPIKNEEGGGILSRDGAPCDCHSCSVKMRKLQKIFQSAVEENVRNITAYVTELKERVAKLQYQKQLLVCQVIELKENDAVGCDAADIDRIASDPPKSLNEWRHLLKEKMQKVLRLWHTCHVSIIHRTQFYLLFKGDPSDQIYIEVELNRLRWMQNHIAEVNNAIPATTGGKPNFSLSTSIKKLRKERKFLAKRLNSRMIDEEREYLYTQWHISLDGKKRKLQLVNKLWTDPNDPIHIEESTNLVARLVEFCEGGNVTKEMYELNLPLPSSKKQ